MSAKGIGSILTAPLKAVGNLVGAKTPKMPEPVTAEAITETGTSANQTPTIDDARAAAEAETRNAQRKGRLANYMTPTNTGAQLSTSPGAGLKRMLGA